MKKNIETQNNKDTNQRNPKKKMKPTSTIVKKPRKILRNISILCINPDKVQAGCYTYLYICKDMNC